MNKNGVSASPFTETPRTRKRFHGFHGTALILSLTLAPGLMATPLTSLGTAILEAGNGSVQVSGNGSTSGCIDWYSAVAPSTCQPSGTMSTFTVDGGSTTPFAAGQTGTISDLNFNTPFPVVDFMTVSNGAMFDLKDIRVNTGATIGDCTVATGDETAGATCVPTGSPFQITNGLIDPNTGTVDTVTISFTVDAYGYTGTSGSNYSAATPYVGIFTTQTPVSGNINTILQTITNGGSIQGSWSASFAPVTTSSTPEPATLGLVGMAFIGLGLIGRRRVRNS